MILSLYEYLQLQSPIQTRKQPCFTSVSLLPSSLLPWLLY